MRMFKKNYGTKHSEFSRNPIIPAKRLFLSDIPSTTFKDVYALLDNLNNIKSQNNTIYSYAKKVNGLDNIKL